MMDKKLKEIEEGLEQLSYEELTLILKNISSGDEKTTNKILKEIEILTSPENQIKKILANIYEKLQSIEGLVYCFDDDMINPYKDQEDVEIDFGEEVKEIVNTNYHILMDKGLYDKALKFITCAILLVLKSENECDFILDMLDICEKENEIKEKANTTEEVIDEYFQMAQDAKYKDVCDFFLDDKNYF